MTTVAEIEVSQLAQSPAWLRVKAAASALQPLQAANGSIDDPEAHDRARELVGDLVGGMTKLLRRVLGEDIVLESRFAPELPAIFADPGMIEQVLMNLAVNARDAMPRGGRLLIELDAVALDESQARRSPKARAGRFVCLSVTDTGAGIAAENLVRIFEPSSGRTHSVEIGHLMEPSGRSRPEFGNWCFPILVVAPRR